MGPIGQAFVALKAQGCFGVRITSSTFTRGEISINCEYLNSEGDSCIIGHLLRPAVGTTNGVLRSIYGTVDSLMSRQVKDVYPALLVHNKGLITMAQRIHDYATSFLEEDQNATMQECFKKVFTEFDYNDYGRVILHGGSVPHYLVIKEMIMNVFFK